MNIIFIGASGHLETGAPGHFETFHKGLFQAFCETLGEKNCAFWGLRDSGGQFTWFHKVLPRSLTSTISWMSHGDLARLGEFIPSCESCVILSIYEGNVANLFLFCSFARRYKNVFLHFNLFGAYKYAGIFESSVRTTFMKIIFKLASRHLGPRLILTADTRRSAEFISTKLRRTVLTFPIYSVLTPNTIKHSSRERVLLNFRGEESERLFMEAIDAHPELNEIQIDLHGIHQVDIKNYFLKFKNLRLLPDQIPEGFYKHQFALYRRVGFLYDPQFFSMQSSGRLADAITSNCEIVVPKGTSLEDYLMEFGNGSSFDFQSAPSLGLALFTEPKVKRQPSYLPTSKRAAELILERVESEILRSEIKSVRFFSEKSQIILDELIRSLLWFLRIITGARNLFKSKKN